MTAKISIIVPVYNVEEFLPRCLRSIEEQTMREGVETILVDDGSPDRCGEICDAFARAHPRTARVIHQQNAGPSAARNAGLAAARGDYVLFLDSDDFLMENACERAYGLAQETGVDIVSFECFKLRAEDLIATLAPLKRERELMGPAEAFRRMMYTWDLAATVWGKLYRRALFDDLSFPVGMLCEDTFLLPSLLARAKSVLLLPERLYFYRQRPGSVLHLLGTTIVDDRLAAHQEVARVIKEHIPELAGEVPQYLYCIRIRCLQEILMLPRFRRHPCWKGHMRAFRRLLPKMLLAARKGMFDAHMKRYALALAFAPDLLSRRLRRRRPRRFANYVVAGEAQK